MGEWRWGQATLRPVAVDKPKLETSSGAKVQLEAEKLLAQGMVGPLQACLLSL